MPKKTRKQKALATQHRTKQENHHSSPSHTYTISLPTSSISTTKMPSTSHNTHAHASDYRHIRQDLWRIGIFTFLAILGNGVLYFLTY